MLRFGNKWHHYFWVFGLFLVNFVLKVIHLDYGDISGDEPFTLFYAQGEWDFMVQMFPGENNPPLHFVLMHFWIKLFGISPFSVRFSSLIFSAMLASGIFLLGKRIFNNSIGIFSSLIFTFSSFHIYFAHEARVYALLAMLSCFSMLAFLKVLAGRPKRKQVIVWVLLNGLLLYSHFFGTLIVLVQVLFVAPKIIKDFSKHKAIFAGFLATLLLFVPYLPTLFHRFKESSGGTWLETPTFEGLYVLLWKFSNQPVNTVLFMVLLFAGLIIKRFRKQTFSIEEKLLWFWFLFPILFVFIVSFHTPMFLDRYLVFVSIPFYLLVSTSVFSVFNNKAFSLTVSLGLVALMMFTSEIDAKNNREPSKLAEIIKQNEGPTTLTLMTPNWIDKNIAYHYDKDVFKNYRRFDELLKEKHIFSVPPKLGFDFKDRDSITEVILIEGWSEEGNNASLKKSILDKFESKRVLEEYKGYKLTFFTRK